VSLDPVSLEADAAELEARLADVLELFAQSLNRNQLHMLGASLIKAAAEIAVVQELSRTEFVFFAERGYDRAAVAVRQMEEHP
jgi:hypothetical protein